MYAVDRASPFSDSEIVALRRLGCGVFGRYYRRDMSDPTFMSENLFESEDIIITRFAGPANTTGIQINVRDWRTGRWVHAQVPWASFVEMCDALYDKATA